MGCSPPGSSVHGILQARIPEWVVAPSSRGSSWPRDWTHVPCDSCITGGFSTSEPLGKPVLQKQTRNVWLVSSKVNNDGESCKLWAGFWYSLVCLPPLCYKPPGEALGEARKSPHCATLRLLLHHWRRCLKTTKAFKTSLRRYEFSLELQFICLAYLTSEPARTQKHILNLAADCLQMSQFPIMLSRYRGE